MSPISPGCEYCYQGQSLIQQYIESVGHDSPCESRPDATRLKIAALKSATMRNAIHTIGYWNIEFTTGRLDSALLVQRVLAASRSGNESLVSDSPTAVALYRGVGHNPRMCDNQLRGLLILSFSRVFTGDIHKELASSGLSPDSEDVATFIEHLAGMVANPSSYERGN